MEHAYTIKRFEMIPLAALAPHPEALVPIDEGDQTAINNSVAEMHAIYNALLVVEGENGKAGKSYRIVDGINRAMSAQRAKIAELPCLVIETDDVRQVVMANLATRRKCTTGQRVLAFILTHKRQVFEAAAIAQEANLFSGRAGKKPIMAVSYETAEKIRGFTAIDIAARLGVCKEDVLKAIELAREMEAEEDAEKKARLSSIYEEVLQGSMPVRRWRPAMEGRYAKQSGKASINYYAVADRGTRSIITAFQNWKKIAPDRRARIETLWREYVHKLMPEQLK